MKILIFEYSTCASKENLVSEGYGILKSILDDLEKIASFDVDYLIRKDFNITTLHCHKIILNDNLLNWLNKNSFKYDYCLFIAPEDDLIQYKITRILEENNVKLLTSDSISSYICSSKSLTYDKTPNDILKIQSIIINTFNYDSSIINDKIKYNDIICKPDNYTSSNFIYHTTKNNISEIIEIYKKNNIKKMIIQQYITGNTISISAIVNKNDINIISINQQLIKKEDNHIKYIGCISPINHPLKNEIKAISEKIIKSINGLKGFVGIDYIINNKKIYFVEINSRITTPYIVLSKLSDENLTKYLIESVISDRNMRKIKFNENGEFYNEK